MKKIVLPIIILGILTLFSCNNKKSEPIIENLSPLVNPFVGTGGHGHTFPGATLPFGMMQLSPDTRLDGWDGCGGYHYSDSLVFGFSHTHLSGTGVSDYGDILLLPMSGEARIGKQNMPISLFSHDKEAAAPGYYKVYLEDYQVTAELSTSIRTGMHKYTFDNPKDARILLDLKHRDLVSNGHIEKISDTELRGSRFSSNWANDQKLFFVMKFSKPYTKSIDKEAHAMIAKDGDTTKKVLQTELFFDLQSGDEILVKVGISAVDMDGAIKNLEEEISDWDFEKVKQDAQEIWDKQLSKVRIKGGTKKEQKTFYSALYHSFIAPNTYSDVDGRYRGRDQKIHAATHDYYTVFSLWDTYRTTHPLFTLLETKRTEDFINTFILQWEQGGLLPIWELSACETNCMIGNHAIPVIADAILKDMTGFDIEKAYKSMITSVEQDNHDFNVYREKGFIPSNEGGSSVSVTLEYAFDDWCVAQVAKKLGKEDDYKKYIQRAQYYKNLLDPETNCMRPRINGGWKSPFDPKEVDFNYTEANAWQYSFYAPQDVMGLAKLMGGEEAFENQLDSLFEMEEVTTGRHQADITGLIGQYAHGNEPSHHMAYLYNYIGKAWKSQYYVDRIFKEMYTDEPDGYIGNEDCGQMSAWYVMSTMGFYPVAPSGQDYIIGTPLFPEMHIQLENGNSLEIIAEGRNAENMYIQSATWNGEELTQSFIRHDQLMKGGKLSFVMGSTPNKDWGTAIEDRPKSEITDFPIVVSPWLDDPVFGYLESKTIKLNKRGDDTKIFLLDAENESLEYTRPITIKGDTQISFYSVQGDNKSATVDAAFHIVPKGRSITIVNPFSTMYTGGGQNALIDLQRGGRHFGDGSWQAYQKEDLDVTIDLSKTSKINSITVGMLQDINSWVWMPLWIDIYTSVDGKTFKLEGRIESNTPKDQWGMIVKDFSLKLKGTSAKYVRVHAKNRGMCPPWHKGYEHKGEAWLFTDEILID